MPAAPLPALALALLIAALAACGRSEVPSDPRPTPQTPAPVPAEEPPQAFEDVIEPGPGETSFRFEAYAYDCEGLEVAVRPGDDELVLILPDRSITLPKVESASGANYADGDTGFWGKGVDEALLTLEGEDTPCQLDRARTPWVDARARGAEFRGLGQEPGWHIEVHPERLVMVYQYGRQRVVVPNPGVTTDPDQPIRRWLAATEAHELHLTVEERGCTDIMSGESYPTMVRVKLDGRDYSGCGRDLD